MKKKSKRHIVENINYIRKPETLRWSEKKEARRYEIEII